MFDPATETMPNWEFEIRDDVIDECNKQGGILHIYVDKTSAQGNVYVKCTSVNAAVAAVNSLHGRWFAGLSCLYAGHLICYNTCSTYEMSLIKGPRHVEAHDNRM